VSLVKISSTNLADSRAPHRLALVRRAAKGTRPLTRSGRQGLSFRIRSNRNEGQKLIGGQGNIVYVWGCVSIPCIRSSLHRRPASGGDFRLPTAWNPFSQAVLALTPPPLGALRIQHPSRCHCHCATASTPGCQEQGQGHHGSHYLSRDRPPLRLR
jgi:hypothetical protein